MSTYSSVCALNPTPTGLFLTFSNITDGSKPAFIEICLVGSSSALRIILPPIFSSPCNFSTTSVTFGKISIYAVPPPGTIPSSTAAFVAEAIEIYTAR